MKLLPTVYKIGCWAFVLVGVGHIVTSMLIPTTPERTIIVQTMKEFSISMIGTESNLYLFHEGFSLMMGILLISYGLLNLSMLKTSEAPSKNTIIVNAATSIIALVISIKYFFLVPTTLLSIAFLCFLMALIINQFSKNIP